MRGPHFDGSKVRRLYSWNGSADPWSLAVDFSLHGARKRASCLLEPPAGSLNFAANLYFIEVRLFRSTTAVTPQLIGFRIF